MKVVVVDSASTDGTIDICGHHGVEVLQVPPGNMYSAINAGLRHATSPWLAYVNSDDFVFPNAYAAMLEWAVNRDASVVYGRGDYVSPDGAFLHSLTPPEGGRAVGLLKCGIMPFLQPAAIFRRDTWQAAGGFCDKYRHVSDFDFFCRLAKSGYRFEYFRGGPVVAFRLDVDQLSSRESSTVRREHALAMQKLELRPTAGDRLHWAAWKAANIPSYCSRIVRYSSILGRLRLPKTMELPGE
jgi:teichuronic acid biosynthesis glycosyltransferase TuaG